MDQTRESPGTPVPCLSGNGLGAIHGNYTVDSDLGKEPRGRVLMLDNLSGIQPSVSSRVASSGDRAGVATPIRPSRRGPRSPRWDHCPGPASGLRSTDPAARGQGNSPENQP